MRRLAVIVLAAGRGVRFGGPKLAAPLDGRPLIAHVLGAIAAARPIRARIEEVVVVTGFHADAVERAVDGVGVEHDRRAGAVPGLGGSAGAVHVAPPVRVVRNPDAARGIGTSLRAGLAAFPPGIEGALVVLGDQPRITPATIEAVVDAWAAGRTEIIVPRYAAGGGSNPALLDRRVWPLAAGLAGDQGMVGVIAAHPELVARVDVPGSNPDVDTPEDLAAL